MADKYDKQKTARLPLIESVIIIAIFAVVSVIIMQMYLSADRIQKKAVNISKATIMAENRAEKFRPRTPTLALPRIRFRGSSQWKTGARRGSTHCPKAIS